jgi:hypothetical protein
VSWIVVKRDEEAWKYEVRRRKYYSGPATAYVAVRSGSGRYRWLAFHKARKAQREYGE